MVSGRVPEICKTYGAESLRYPRPRAVPLSAVKDGGISIPRPDQELHYQLLPSAKKSKTFTTYRSRHLNTKELHQCCTGGHHLLLFLPLCSHWMVQEMVNNLKNPRRARPGTWQIALIPVLQKQDGKGDRCSLSS